MFLRAVYNVVMDAEVCIVHERNTFNKNLQSMKCIILQVWSISRERGKEQRNRNQKLTQEEKNIYLRKYWGRTFNETKLNKICGYQNFVSENYCLSWLEVLTWWSGTTYCGGLKEAGRQRTVIYADLR